MNEIVRKPINEKKDSFLITCSLVLPNDEMTYVEQTPDKFQKCQYQEVIEPPLGLTHEYLCPRCNQKVKLLLNPGKTVDNKIKYLLLGIHIFIVGSFILWLSLLLFTDPQVYNELICIIPLILIMILMTIIIYSVILLLIPYKNSSLAQFILLPILINKTSFMINKIIDEPNEKYMHSVSYIYNHTIPIEAEIDNITHLRRIEIQCYKDYAMKKYIHTASFIHGEWEVHYASGTTLFEGNPFWGKNIKKVKSIKCPICEDQIIIGFKDMGGKNVSEPYVLHAEGINIHSHSGGTIPKHKMVLNNWIAIDKK
jgi:hypothetical protein